MGDDDEKTGAEEQNEEYEKLRAEGKDKLEAANEAAPAGSTEAVAEEAEEEA